MAHTKIGRGLKITFLGHAAFKLEGAGVTVLIDPWLSNPSRDATPSQARRLILLHKTSVEPRACSLDVGLGVCEYSAPLSPC